MKHIYYLSIISLIFSCQPKKYEYLQLSGPTQGTSFHITYENSVSKDLSKEIDSILHCIDKSMSVYDSSSIISKINRNDSLVTLDPMLIEVIQRSLFVNSETNGAFDITVGPLVKAWGFGPDNALKRENANIDTLLKYVGSQNIQLAGNKLIKKHKQVVIDVNAIAQGYSVDVVCRFFDSLEIKNYLVEIGGEVRAKGINAKGMLWKIGVDKPVDGNNSQGENISAVVELNNKSLATSGNYRKFYTENGVKYSHTIDPKTGYPAKNNLLSATIIATDCTMADAYATACMVFGFEKSKIFLASHPELEAVLIYNDEKGTYREYLTKGVKDLMNK